MDGLQYRPEKVLTDGLVGYVHEYSREKGKAVVTTLEELRDTQVDMFVTVFIGNSHTQEYPRKTDSQRLPVGNGKEQA